MAVLICNALSTASGEHQYGMIDKMNRLPRQERAILENRELKKNGNSVFSIENIRMWTSFGKKVCHSMGEYKMSKLVDNACL